MKATGKMICNMVMGKKSGLIIQNMKVNIMKVKSMEREPMFGLMVVNMKEIGLKIGLKVMEHTLG